MSGGLRPSFIRSEVYKAFTQNATLDSGDNISWTPQQVVAAIRGGYNERVLYGPFYWYGAASGDLRWEEVNSRMWSIDPEAGVAVLWSNGSRHWADGSPWATVTVARLVEVPGTGWRVSHLLRASDFRSSRAWGRFARIEELHRLISSPPGTTVPSGTWEGAPSFPREYLLQDRLQEGFSFRGADGVGMEKQDFIARGPGADPVAAAANLSMVKMAMRPGGEVVAWSDGGGAVAYGFDDIGVRIASATVVGLPAAAGNVMEQGS